MDSEVSTQAYARHVRGALESDVRSYTCGSTRVLWTMRGSSKIIERQVPFMNDQNLPEIEGGTAK
jgi:hypothetical protein